MSRRQIDFDVRVFPLGTGAGGESMTHDQVGEFIRENYLKSGWEVFDVNTNQVSAGVVYLQVALVKYEDVLVQLTPPELAGDGTGVEVKRGPGRPKKVETESEAV